MNYKPALYVNGRVVTGLNHGMAYSKLSAEEKKSILTSGFLDHKIGKFVTEDDQEFYVKKIILIRHAQASDDYENNPGITKEGHSQAERVAHFISTFSNISKYTVLSSPLRRCEETASIISNEAHMESSVCNKLADQDKKENCDEFVSRLRELLHDLPTESILISHCNFIVNMVKLALINEVNPNWNSAIPNASLTFVDHHKLVWMGKKDFE